MITGKSELNQSLTSAPEENMYKIIANADIVLRKLNKTNVFLVGSTRVGKSTLFNYLMNSILIGTKKKGANPVYTLKLDNGNMAEANDGLKSVTLYPNIQTKDGITYSDMAGFADKRAYGQVMGVSFMLKGAFQRVKLCKFVLVISNNSVQNQQAGQLITSIGKFIRMFEYKSMTQYQKEALFKSTVLTIAKADQGKNIQQYIQRFKTIIQQIQDSEYQDRKDDHQAVIEAIKFFIKTRNIYLFFKAQENIEAPACTIIEDNIQKAQYFDLEDHEFQFKKKNPNLQSIIRLPFNDDFENLSKPLKQQLRNKLKQRIDSYTQLAKILIGFFQKTLDKKNIFDPNLQFDEHFEKIKRFNEKWNFYSQDFDIEKETGVQRKFSTNNNYRKLQSGIKMALRVFELYDKFEKTPQTENADNTKGLTEFMQSFKKYLIEMFTLFRTAFCKNTQEQQQVLKLLFIAVRGCRQFSMIYSFSPENKHDMILRLKDSFLILMGYKPLHKIEQEFVEYLSKGQKEIMLNLSSEESGIYTRYLTQFVEKNNGYEFKAKICDSPQFVQLYSKFLQLKANNSIKPEDKLVSFYENYMNHKDVAKEVLKKYYEEQDDTESEVQYPEAVNFKFYYILSNIGYNLLELNRGNSAKEDVFIPEISKQSYKGVENLKKILTQAQATLAKNIFMYIGSVEYVIKSYEQILRNIDEKELQSSIQWIQGFADYCSNNGRIQDAFTKYQYLLGLCYLNNLYQKSVQIKRKLIDLPEKQKQFHKDYLLRLKQKRIIEPSSDTGLAQLMDQLRDDYIIPYKQYMGQKMAKNSQNDKE